MYLWLKFFHIFFIIAWFAGLFYLPRIYVNLALAQTPEEYSRLLIMAQKLYKFMTPWGIGALIFGTLMLAQLPAAGWTHGKLTIGILLAAYHIACRQLLIAFKQHRNTPQPPMVPRLQRNPCIRPARCALPRPIQTLLTPKAA